MPLSRGVLTVQQKHSTPKTPTARLALPDDDDMLPEDYAIGMGIPDPFRCQASRPAVLDSSVVKRGVLVRLGMRWLCWRHPSQKSGADP